MLERHGVVLDCYWKWTVRSVLSFPSARAEQPTRRARELLCDADVTAHTRESVCQLVKAEQLNECIFSQANTGEWGYV